MALHNNRNKGRTKGSGLIANPFYAANFQGFKVTAHQWPTRFVVCWEWNEAKESNPGFLAFRDALNALVEFTNYRHTQHGSLIGELCSDWEPAHIFVALNLHELENHAAGKWTHFHDPSYCCWMAMEAGYRYGRSAG